MVKTYTPKTIGEALQIMADTHAIPYAGGTDLMVQLRRGPGLIPRFERPVVFLTQLPELQVLQCANGFATIGSAVTLSRLIGNTGLPEILKRACRLIGAPAIQNMATIGGNLCNASPAGDTIPPLYTLDAVLQLSSITGDRDVSVMSFFRGPGETILQPEELLTSIRFRIPHFDFSTYKKIGTRKANALSKLSFAGAGTVNNGKLEEIRIAIGAVAPTVIRSHELEQQLVGQVRDKLPDLIPALLKGYAQHIQPITDQRSDAFYRKETALNLIKNFVLMEEL